ncbi:MAG: tRNA (adenosine(37)-N6)-threonylcarbamoyltransferase complex dimerization subunit type 1 TsaB [Bacteroidota bacterium]
MSLILSLDTTTKVCSVAIHSGGRLLNLQESRDDDYTHAEKLNVFIEKALKETGLKPAQLDAVAIAGGPGSYTGLRIGASSAKGLCYALSKPLISIDPLEALALACKENFLSGQELIFPMIDARRDEVFMSVFDAQLNRVEETSAQIIDQQFFDKYPDKTCILAGDGAAKFQSLFSEHPLITVLPDCLASAVYIGRLAEEKFRNSAFEDLAYYEPFYGKEFKTTVSKKLSKIHTSNS